MHVCLFVFVVYVCVRARLSALVFVFQQTCCLRKVQWMISATNL